jgi:hypothetical protein
MMFGHLRNIQSNLGWISAVLAAAGEAEMSTVWKIATSNEQAVYK